MRGTTLWTLSWQSNEGRLRLSDLVVLRKPTQPYSTTFAHCTKNCSRVVRFSLHMGTRLNFSKRLILARSMPQSSPFPSSIQTFMWRNSSEIGSWCVSAPTMNLPRRHIFSLPIYRKISRFFTNRSGIPTPMRGCWNCWEMRA
jgi:hypothetical protein